MSRTILAALLAGAALPAGAACIFDGNDEITNPFATGCGDVLFTYTDADNSGNHIALGFPPPVPVASMTAVAGFREYASLFAQHQSLLALHDEVDGEVVGETLAGREIWAYVIGDADAITAEGFAEGAVLVNGGIHAREWQTPEAVTAVFEALVAGKADGGLVQYLVENLNTVLVPVNNVDGFIQTQLYPASVTADREQPREGRMRRKNLRNPATNGAIDSDIGTIADNFWGVDLNRNATQGFGQQGASTDARDEPRLPRRRLPTPSRSSWHCSRPRRSARTSRLRFFSDTHSFGQVYLAPTPPNTRLNAITQALGVHMADASGRNYGFGPDLPGSPGIGTTADHFTFTYEIPGWTLELEPANGGQDYGGLASHGHSGFILPDAEAARMRDDVARQYLLGFYRQSGPPAAVAAEIRALPGNTVVYRARWEAERRRRADARSRSERGAGAGRRLPALGRLQQADAHPRLPRATSCPMQARARVPTSARSPSKSRRSTARTSRSAAEPGSGCRAARRTATCATRTTPLPSTSRCPTRSASMPQRPPCCS